MTRPETETEEYQMHAVHPEIRMALGMPEATLAEVCERIRDLLQVEMSATFLFTGRVSLAGKAGGEIVQALGDWHLRVLTEWQRSRSDRPGSCGAATAPLTLASPDPGPEAA